MDKMAFNTKLIIANGLKYVSFEDFMTDMRCSFEYIQNLLDLYDVEWDEKYGMEVESLIKAIKEKSLYDELKRIVINNHGNIDLIDEEYIYFLNEPYIIVDCLFQLKDFSIKLLMFDFCNPNARLLIVLDKKYYLSFSGLVVLDGVDKIMKESFYKKNDIIFNTYLILDERTGLYKIGKSKSALEREKTLQSEYPLLKLIFCLNINIERLLHLKYANKRVRGEWFRLNPDDIIDIYKIYKNHILKDGKK